MRLNGRGAGRRGRRERRPDGRRDQHDRRQARAPAPDGPERALARRRSCPGSRPGAVVTVVAPGRPAPDARGAGGEQLPLVGGPARPLRPRRRDHGPVADRPLPVGRQRASGATSRPTASCGSRLRRPSRSSPRRPRRPRSRAARRRRGTAGRSRGSGTTRRSTCSGWAARREPVQARDLFDLVGRDLAGLARDAAGSRAARRRSATPPTACSSGARRTGRTSTGRSRSSPGSCARSASRPTSRAPPAARRRRSATASPPRRSPPAGTTARTRRSTTPTRATRR